MNIEEQVQTQRDRIRKRLLKYTRKAFRLLPPLDKPRILDIGCGSGVPAMELAGLTNGVITGIDIDPAMLDRFRRKIEKAGLADRFDIINRSAKDMNFAEESFDLIWAEGSINIIGFERGLLEWKRFLKPGGYLVIHDEKGNIEKKLEQIATHGYRLLGRFELSRDVWRTEYFTPMEVFVSRTLLENPGSHEVRQALQREQEELDFFRKNPASNDSIFLVLQLV